MPLVHNRSLFPAAADHRSGMAAFNVITLEHAQGIVAGAESVQRPVILQLSENAIAYHGGPRAIAAAMVAVAEDATVDVALHLDHITSTDLVRETAKLGFSSVMFDGAHLPYSENVRATRDAALWARECGVWLEAELGEIGGKDGAHAPGVRTDPAEATSFVDATGVDALAVAVGSSHAMTTQTASLDLDLISKLRDSLSVPLVLHGSSGVADETLAAAVDHGMVKINIGTALNLAFTSSVREVLHREDALTDPRKYCAPGRASIADTVSNYLRVINGRSVAHAA